MDEPTSALDPISTTKVEELITSLRDSYTIVIVTHNMQQAARISDETAFFYMGELVEIGPTQRIFPTLSINVQKTTYLANLANRRSSYVKKHVSRTA